MAGYNKVILMGKLTRDPELRYTQNNKAICKCGMAVNQRVKKGDEWVDEATFVDFTIFGARGEAFEKYNKKGGDSFIEGSLRLDTWDDKTTGAKRTKLYVVADNWEFCGSRGDGGERKPQPRRSAGSVTDRVAEPDPFEDEPPF